LKEEKMKLFLTLALVASLAACMSTGKQVTQEAALQFKEGVATEVEILSKLGQPTGMSVQGGKKFLTYSGMQVQVKGATFIPFVGAFAGGSDYTMSTAIYQLGPDGILEKITFSTSGAGSRMGSTPAEMPSQEPSAVKN
jgi:outer membrane protein assembly factor BamE (lipoprotein component of BamABCDE complex)